MNDSTIGGCEGVSHHFRVNSNFDKKDFISISKPLVEDEDDDDKEEEEKNVEEEYKKNTEKKYKAGSGAARKGEEELAEM